MHYCNHIKSGQRWEVDEYIPRWEQIDFKTLREAEEYLTIAGDNAYIIDNITNKKVKEL